jgi:hypothetical protein
MHPCGMNCNAGSFKKAKSFFEVLLPFSMYLNRYTVHGSRFAVASVIELVEMLNDGHTSLLPDVNKNLIYPFVFFKDKQNIYLAGINKEQESFLGKQITQINRQPTLDVLNSFKPAISSDNEVYFYDKVNDYMQLYSSWQNNPYCLPDSSLQLTFADTTNVSLRPVSIKEINLSRFSSQTSANSVRENGKQPFLYKLLPEKDICYLQFNTCTDQSALRSQYYMSNANNLSEEELEKRLSQYPRAAERDKTKEFFHPVFRTVGTALSGISSRI